MGVFRLSTSLRTAVLNTLSEASVNNPACCFGWENSSHGSYSSRPLGARLRLSDLFEVWLQDRFGVISSLREIPVMMIEMARQRYRRRNVHFTVSFQPSSILWQG